MAASWTSHHHPDDPATLVDQGLTGDGGALDPDQDQAGAAPAGVFLQGGVLEASQDQARQRWTAWSTSSPLARSVQSGPGSTCGRLVLLMYHATIQLL